MLAQSVAYNAAGRVGGLAVGFASSVLLARWLGPADRGLLGVLTTATGFGMVLFGFGIPTAVTYLASIMRGATATIFGTTISVAAALAVVLVPATWAASSLLADAFTGGEGAVYWPFAAALVSLTFLDWTTHNQLIAQLRFAFFNALTLVARIAALVATVAFVGLLGWGVTGGLAATGLLSVVMIAGAVPTLLRTGGRPRFDLDVLRRLARYGVRVQAGSALQSLNYRLDLMLLGVFRPLDEVGSYFVASFMAELVLTVSQSFELVPLVSRAETDAGRNATTVSAIRHHQILAFAATLGNLVFGPIVILGLMGNGYRDALLPFFILLVGMIPAGTGTVAGSDLRGRNRPGTASLYAGIALVVTVVGDLALIPPFGPVGAAVVSVLAYTLYSVVSVRGLGRLTGNSWRELAVPTAAEVGLYLRLLQDLARNRLWRSRREAT